MEGAEPCQRPEPPYLKKKTTGPPREKGDWIESGTDSAVRLLME